MEQLVRLAIFLSLCSVICANPKSVLIRDNSTGQLYTSSLLSWEAFNNDDLILKHAVVGGVFTGEDTSKAYVCRATINTIPVSGYIRKRINGDKTDYLCIISQHSIFRSKGQFDVLVNRGGGAKLHWVGWEKLKSFSVINGAVSTVNGGAASEVYYVARHKKNHSMEHHDIDHAIGWFDPSDGLGKVYATVASKEESFVEGEILTATEAIRYELSEIKFINIKLRQKVNRTLLGQTILKNEGDVEMDVNAVIGYDYDVERNFGTQDGIARSVNTTAFMSKNEKIDFYWGIQKNDHAVSSRSVGTRLLPGTAINVTLWGKYVTNEGPYKAYLVTYWADGTKSKKRQIQVQSGMEKNLEEESDIEYSPTYWLLNNTVVPTTTQRTVTSTSTQSVHKSIFVTSSRSNEIEEITKKSGMLNAEPELDEEDENEIDTSGASKVALSCMLVLTLFKAYFI